MQNLRLRRRLNLFESLRKCHACGLSEGRKNVVIGRGVGSYVGRLLFIGEAPGKTEDVIGEPFVGDSGRLLADMLKEANISDYFITNTILCRPTNNREPRKDEVLLCAENVHRIIRFIDPSAVCFIGRVSERYYKGKIGVPEFQVIHPAALLRSGGKGTFQYRDAIVKLKLIRRSVYDSQT